MLTTKLYPGYKVYGPYTRNNDGRKQVSVVKGEHYITLQYAKFLIQEHIGRLLTNTEEVHHIDEDKTNDSLTNLEVVDANKHRKMNVTVGNLIYDLECQMCSKHIVLTHRQYQMTQYRWKNGQTSPFCSQRCAANYGNQFKRK